MATQKQTTLQSGLQLDAEAQKWGELYAKEEKVTLKIAADPLNRQDKVVPVCVNGYNYFINRGQTVQVPKTIALLLTQAGYI
ncbi:MAG: hypothetical protein PHG02_00375 [Oscillospiraceae bacterium]|nr:hypothetical protein [Oscillospiraceae bacterium]